MSWIITMPCPHCNAENKDNHPDATLMEGDKQLTFRTKKLALEYTKQLSVDNNELNIRRI